MCVKRALRFNCDFSKDINSTPAAEGPIYLKPAPCAGQTLRQILVPVSLGYTFSNTHCHCRKNAEPYLAESFPTRIASKGHTFCACLSTVMPAQ